MAAPKGHPRYGGRTKGTPNKGTIGLREEIESYLGKSLPSAIMERMSGLDDLEAIKVMQDLMTYVYAKRKALEHSVEMPQDVVEKYEELKHLSDEELQKLIKNE